MLCGTFLAYGFCHYAGGGFAVSGVNVHHSAVSLCRVAYRGVMAVEDFGDVLDSNAAQSEYPDEMESSAYGRVVAVGSAQACQCMALLVKTPIRVQKPRNNPI